MAEVIEYNFGKEGREHVRQFCRLLGLLEDHDEKVRADPVKYLNQAGAEIARLRREVFAAWEVVAIACMATTTRFEEPLRPFEMETIRVDKKRYDALCEVYRRVARLAGMSD